MTDQLLTQREAAALLRVSVRYLRDSHCPKVLLPGAKGTSRKLVRYSRDAVLAWAGARTVRQAGAA